MSDDDLKQKLSLLLDGELSKSDSLALMSRVEGDAELRKQWHRYRLISELMRSEKTLLVDDSFVDRVRDALASEPTILAPRSGKHRYREKAVTAALAASLAIVAVLVGKSISEYSPVRGPELLAQTELTGAGNARSGGDPQFQDYLVMHNETAYLVGAPGVLPYARLVTYDSSR
ncbi:sigma-E factor negative regulatory protein [Methylocaldum sp.]|uniref:sigma-E factor negative regulatory protein n=1 Tax=Methylocaldum sp. TaxID=1969727 RepID=UPI002D668E0A|nr:sigma-E factor negative regulatory protein [Methylocaldum sp.]HYE36535.1 sigma-E factor negative regulatory protein [Methylocaldum sp.]